MSNSRSGDRNQFASQSGKKYCKVCNTHIDDNPIALQHHYSGNRHARNVREQLDKQRKEKNHVAGTQRREEREIQRMQRRAGIAVTLSSSSSSSSSDHVPYVRGICYDFQKGACMNGDGCRYRHVLEGSLEASMPEMRRDKDTGSSLDPSGVGVEVGGRHWAQAVEGDGENDDEEDEDEEVDEEEVRGSYVIDGRVYLVGEKHPEKMCVGLMVEVVVGGEYDEEEEEEENSGGGGGGGGGGEEEEEVEVEMSPWTSAVVTSVMYTGGSITEAAAVAAEEAAAAAKDGTVDKTTGQKDSLLSRQWRYKVQLLNGADVGTVRDVLLEDVRVPCAPPPPPVDERNQIHVDDVEMMLSERNMDTGLGGWEVAEGVEVVEEGVEEVVEEEEEEELRRDGTVQLGLSSSSSSIVGKKRGRSDRKLNSGRSGGGVFGGDSDEEEEERVTSSNRGGEGGSVYGGFKVGLSLNKKNLLQSDGSDGSGVAAAAKVTFKKRGKKKKKK